MNNPAVQREIINSFVTCFGLGRSPYAPGTFGSLFGLFVVYLLSFFNWPTFFLFTVLLCTTSILLVGFYLESASSKDPKEVVIDEVVGILISFMLVPVTGLTLVIGFLLFRFFDILKPPPISFFDRKVPGATGVMADDVVAGIIVNLFFHFVLIPMGVLGKIENLLNI